MQRHTQDPHDIQDGNGQKPLTNVTKSTIPDVVRVLEGPRFVWNVINKCKIVSKI